MTKEKLITNKYNINETVTHKKYINQFKIVNIKLFDDEVLYTIEGIAGTEIHTEIHVVLEDNLERVE